MLILLLLSFFVDPGFIFAIWRESSLFQARCLFFAFWGNPPSRHSPDRQNQENLSGGEVGRVLWDQIMRCKVSGQLMPGCALKFLVKNCTASNCQRCNMRAAANWPKILKKWLMGNSNNVWVFGDKPSVRRGGAPFPLQNMLKRGG